MIKITIITPALYCGDLLKQTLNSSYSQHAIIKNRCDLQHIVCYGGRVSDEVEKIESKYANTQFISKIDSSMYDARR